MTMPTYPKLSGPYKRYTDGPNRNKLIIGEWTSDAVEACASLPWIFTEKIDGTNIRVHWDGYKVTFGGRTDNAQIPAKLFEYLSENLTEELFEQQFQATAVTLYGEGCGPKIQKGGEMYGATPNFKLFDVRIGNWWLGRDDVVGISTAMGVPVVPVCYKMNLFDAIDGVTAGTYSAYDYTKLAEGVVGHTAAGLLERNGQRITVKIKTVDFHNITYVTE